MSTPVQAARGSIETIFFLDVDGVLNVALKDIAGAVTLDAENIEAARDLIKSEDRADVLISSKVISATEHSLEEAGEDKGSTYSTFMATRSTGVSSLLVKRFAKLIALAGDNYKVVLSSSWRRPEQSELVKNLQRSVETHLGVPFVFHAVTPATADRCGQDRLDTIGAYLERYSDSSVPSARQRVVVLDDLFCTAVCDLERSAFQSIADAEDYLRRWMPPSATVSINFVHTFEEWRMPNGEIVKVGSGLTMSHVVEVAKFLFFQHSTGKPFIRKTFSTPLKTLTRGVERHYRMASVWLTLHKMLH